MGQVIFDLDGTLADNRHRLDLIQGEEKKWREYLSKTEDDSPVERTIRKLNQLSENHEIVILTMRSDEVEQKTIAWLKESKVNYDDLIMLPEGRWEIKDHEFKKEKIEEMENPVKAFDDRIENCEMFKNHGIEAFHVKNLPEPDFEKV